MYANGKIPTGALVEIQDGLYLTPLAAVSWREVAAGVRDRYGWTPALTDAYRGLDGYYGQVATFLRRYQRTYIQYASGRVDRRVWDGVPYWRKPGTSAAAVPGTSNHGLGVAVDVSGLGDFGSTRHDQFATVAGQNGWSDVEGRSVDEPWHWTKTSASYASNPGQAPGASPSVPDINPIDPITPLEDDMHLISAPGRGQAIIGPGYYRHLSNTEEVQQAGALAKVLEGNDRQFDLWVSIALAGQGAGIAGLAAAVADGVIDENVLAATVTQALVPAVISALGASVGLTTDQVTAATERAVRNVLGGLG